MGHVALVGMMGSGKSTVGRRVAARTGRDFVDLDDEIEQREGACIPEIFAEAGEESFRSCELAALRAVLGRDDPVVVATGGGVVTTAACREVLAGGAHVVWLRADVGTLADRVGDGGGRPLLTGGDPAQALTRLAEERAPLYASVADSVVDTDQLGLDEVAELVVTGLSEAAAS